MTTKAELQAVEDAKKLKRKEIMHKILDGAAIYLAVAGGVIMTEAALDLREAESLSFFQNWSLARFGVSLLIAGAFMTKFEAGGDLIGKKKNLWRRLSHAFGQGAALRGAVEWLALLFALTR